LKTLRATLAVALGAHAVIASAFALAPVRALVAPPSLAAVEHEVSLVDEPADDDRGVTPATERAFDPRIAPGEQPYFAKKTARQRRADGADDSAGASASAPVAVTPIALVREAAPLLDLSAARGYVPSGSGSADRSADRDRAGGSPRTTAIDSVRAALDDHDRALGLGTDSALVAAIRHAALGSRVPVKSSATLWTTAGADGSVTGAEATTATSDIEAWNEVAAEVVRAMKGLRVRAVLGARGARLSFRVESVVRQGAGNAVAPSVRVGTPLYRCMEACTASGNIDPTDALLDVASRAGRFVDVRALSAVRLD